MEDREKKFNGLEDYTLVDKTSSGAMKEQKHFRLTNETKDFNGHTLYRIECIEEFDNGSYRIYIGDRGGFVEKEDNLCENAWLYGDACVCDDAIVRGNASVIDSCLKEHSLIGGHVQVVDGAIIGGSVVIDDSEEISRDAEIAEKNDYIFFANVGSRNDNLTVYRTKYGGVRINVGCFHGSIDEFKHSILITHANNEKVRKEYLAIIEIIKNRFDIDI